MIIAIQHQKNEIWAENPAVNDERRESEAYNETSTIVETAASDKDDVFRLYRSPLTQELIFYRMNKTKEENIREKIQIEVTFAENGKSFIQLAASMFNAVSDQYHVVCDNHRSYGSEDYDALLNQFEKAILKGDVGDIIVYSDKELLEKYSSVFLDMTGYVNPKDYFHCVMDSLKVNNAVYAMSPYFIVHTLVGLKESLPDDDTWTTETFLELKKIHPSKPAAIDKQQTNAVVTQARAIMSIFSFLQHARLT